MFGLLRGVISSVSISTSTAYLQPPLTNHKRKGIIKPTPHPLGNYFKTIVSKALVDLFSDEYDNEYLTPSQIEYEKDKLKKILKKELKDITIMLYPIENKSIINKHHEFKQEIIEFQEKEQYFLAIRHTQKFKIQLAEIIKKKELTVEVNDVLHRIKIIREKSRKL